MYQHSVLKNQGLRALSDIQSTSSSHTKAFPLALAYVLAIDLALPVEEVDDIRAYFRMQHQIGLSSMISAVNELLPHATKVTLEHALAFYSLRYAMLNPQKIPLVFNPDNAVLAFFGITSHVSEDALSGIRENPALLTRLIGGLQVIYEDIKASSRFTAPADQGPMAIVA